MTNSVLFGSGRSQLDDAVVVQFGDSPP